MKKIFLCGVVALAGTAIGIEVCRKTKRKQQKAKAEHNHVPYGPYEAVIKRPMDVILSCIAIVVLSPVMVMIALLVKIKLGSPVLFRQERPGKNGQVFTILKFRTMLEPCSRDGKKLTDAERIHCIEEGIEILSDEERLTKFGRFLRKSSIDELPELFNIIRGEMAIVGPRPLATVYLPYYNDMEKHRHDIRPGLTGLAQINGRNSISWEERFEKDIEYVNHISFIMDISILIKTIMIVVKGENIGQGEEKPQPFNIVRKGERELS